MVLAFVLPVFTVFDLWAVAVRGKSRPRPSGYGLLEPKGQKLTADKLVQRHVESLGSGEVLARRQTFVMMGTCKNEILVGGSRISTEKLNLCRRETGSIS